MISFGGGRIGKTNRAGEIARLIHINQTKARMLLVIRAQATIIGAALLRARLENMRAVARFDVILRQLVIGDVS